MKKLLLIFLLAILPLQFSWAAAAVYCQHEEKQTSHFGHHSHHHEASSDHAKDKASKLKADADCQVCQLAQQASFPGGLPVMLVPDDYARQAYPPQLYSSHIPRGPIPPDWHLVA